MFGVKYLWLIDRIFGASHMAEVLVITLELFLQSDDFSNLFCLVILARFIPKVCILHPYVYYPTVISVYRASL